MNDIINVKSMNQGKLEVVEQEMATVNIDVLGIIKLRWTGMGEFSQMTNIYSPPSFPFHLRGRRTEIIAETPRSGVLI